MRFPIITGLQVEEVNDQYSSSMFQFLVILFHCEILLGFKNDAAQHMSLDHSFNINTPIFSLVPLLFVLSFMST